MRKSICLVIAEDDYLRNQSAKEVIHRFVPNLDENPFAVEKVEASTESAAAAVNLINQGLNALRTANFFSDTKVVWLKNAFFFGENAIGKATAVKEAVEKLSEQIKTAMPERQYLVISANKVSKRSAFYKACEKNAEIVEVAATSQEAMSWNYADTVFRRDLVGALTVMKQLLAQKESPIAIVGSLEKRISQLMILRSCLDCGMCRLQHKGEWVNVIWPDGVPGSELLDKLGSDNPRAMHPYRAAQLAKCAQTITLAVLGDLREETLRTRQRLVTTSLSEEYLLTYITAYIVQKISQPSAK